MLFYLLLAGVASSRVRSRLDGSPAYPPSKALALRTVFGSRKLSGEGGGRLPVFQNLSGRWDVRLTFDIELPELLYRELIENCRDASCHPKVFAAEALESVLASRRLPKVEMGQHGARLAPVTEAAIPISE